MPGPGPGDSAPSVAVVAELRWQSQPGNVVLSRGPPNRDELAAQGQAAPDEAAITAGCAGPGNRRLEQRRASTAAGNCGAALHGNPPIAESGRGLGFVVPG